MPVVQPREGVLAHHQEQSLGRKEKIPELSENPFGPDPNIISNEALDEGHGIASARHEQVRQRQGDGGEVPRDPETNAFGQD